MAKTEVLKFFQDACSFEPNEQEINASLALFEKYGFDLWDAIMENTTNSERTRLLCEYGQSEIEIFEGVMIYVDWESSDMSGSRILSIGFDEDFESVYAKILSEHHDCTDIIVNSRTNLRTRNERLEAKILYDAKRLLPHEFSKAYSKTMAGYQLKKIKVQDVENYPTEKF